jgi:hypothetical protein
MSTSFLAGSRVRSTVTFVPESGTVLLTNVTARAIDAEGNVTTLTPVAGSTNVFTADVAIPDSAISGPWVVRWESSTPKIVVDDPFSVSASAMLNP